MWYNSVLARCTSNLCKRTPEGVASTLLHKEMHSCCSCDSLLPKFVVGNVYCCQCLWLPLPVVVTVCCCCCLTCVVRPLSLQQLYFQKDKCISAYVVTTVCCRHCLFVLRAAVSALPLGQLLFQRPSNISAFVTTVWCCRCLLMLLLSHLLVIVLSHLLLLLLLLSCLLALLLCHLPRSDPLSLGRPSLSLLAERMEASLSLSLSLSLSASISLMASLALLAEFMWAGPADLPPACKPNKSSSPSITTESVCTLATDSILNGALCIVLDSMEPQPKSGTPLSPPSQSCILVTKSASFDFKKHGS